MGKGIGILANNGYAYKILAPDNAFSNSILNLTTLMSIAVYDTNENGRVDDADKVNNLTVETAVPTNAVFTDTTYSVGDGGLTEINFTSARRDQLVANTFTLSEMCSVVNYEVDDYWSYMNSDYVSFVDECLDVRPDILPPIVSTDEVVIVREGKTFKTTIDILALNFSSFLIVSKTIDYSVTVESQTILCDASSNDIIITLPNTSQSLISNKSISVGVSKIDTSNNEISIVGSGGALVAGEASQRLYYQNEVLNFVTDGTNWWLGA